MKEIIIRKLEVAEQSYNDLAVSAARIVQMERGFHGRVSEEEINQRKSQLKTDIENLKKFLQEIKSEID